MFTLCFQHRLQVALTKQPSFTPQALQAIYESTKGIPRRINTLCDFSLLVGANSQQKMIDADLIEQIVQDGI